MASNVKAYNLKLFVYPIVI